MFWIAVELSNPIMGLIICLSVRAKKLTAFKKDWVAKFGSTVEFLHVIKNVNPYPVSFCFPTDDIVYAVYVKMNEVEKDGKKYWNMDDMKLKLKTARKVETYFDLVPHKQVSKFRQLAYKTTNKDSFRRGSPPPEFSKETFSLNDIQRLLVLFEETQTTDLQ